MKTRRPLWNAPTHQVSSLFTFGLFGMFALLSLLIVVIGASGYSRVVDSSDMTGQVRTTLGYVAGKLRSTAARDGVWLHTQDGLKTLTLREIYEDVPYDTVIFFDDGALYEAYLNSDQAAFDPKTASRLVEAGNFEMDWAEEGLLLSLTATAQDGRAQTLHIALRGQGEVTNP